MGFRDDKNEIVGFDVDLAKEVGKRMGMEVVLQPINWDTKELLNWIPAILMSSGMV